MLGQIDDVAGDFGERLAIAIGRRPFLERLVQGAFAVGVTIAVGARGIQPAFAGSCGPSPACPSGRCDDVANRCRGGGTGKLCHNVSYGHTTCFLFHPGCWSSSGHLCCDCCCQDATGTACSSCGSGYRKCHCHFT